MTRDEFQEGSGLFVRDVGRLPPDGRALLDEIGNEEVVKIQIVRTPLSKFLKGFLNLITAGQFDKISKKYFDEVFHLSLWINDRYNLEKNEVIAFNRKNPIQADSQVEDVLNIPPNITFKDLIEKTRLRMGDSDFSNYNARGNNCQDFLVGVFNANSIGDSKDLAFIKQDVRAVFNQIPEVSKIIGNLATKAGAIWNRLLYGEGCQTCGIECTYDYNANLPRCNLDW